MYYTQKTAIKAELKLWQDSAAYGIVVSKRPLCAYSGELASRHYSGLKCKYCPLGPKYPYDGSILICTFALKAYNTACDKFCDFEEDEFDGNDNDEDMARLTVRIAKEAQIVYEKLKEALL